MASAVVMLNAGVIAFTLMIAIATLPTFADQTECTAETTTRCQKDNLIVNTTVTHSADHDAYEADDFSEYEMDVSNDIIIVRRNNKGETETTESSDNSNNSETPTPPTIRSDYTKYDGVGYYKLHESKKKWSEAKRTCEDEGAHLAVINSKEEEDVLKKILHGQLKAFVGFRFQQQKGRYETVLGKPLYIGYVHWDQSVAPPFGDAECGAFWWATGEVGVLQCSIPLPFVCELPA